MTVAIFQGETSMQDLISRLFNMPEATSKATATEAADELSASLIKANPQLSDLNSVAVGTVLTIPAGAPPLNPDERVSPQLSRRAAIAARALQPLASFDQQFAQATGRIVDAAAALQPLAQSQDLTGANSDLKPQLPNLIVSLQATAKQASATRDSSNKMLYMLLTRLQSIATQ